MISQKELLNINEIFFCYFHAVSINYYLINSISLFIDLLSLKKNWTNKYVGT